MNWRELWANPILQNWNEYTEKTHQTDLTPNFPNACISRARLSCQQHLANQVEDQLPAKREKKEDTERKETLQPVPSKTCKQCCVRC